MENNAVVDPVTDNSANLPSDLVHADKLGVRRACQQAGLVWDRSRKFSRTWPRIAGGLISEMYRGVRLDAAPIPRPEKSKK